MRGAEGSSASGRTISWRDRRRRPELVARDLIIDVPLRVLYAGA
jgi:hypothetical protein